MTSRAVPTIFALVFAVAAVAEQRDAGPAPAGVTAEVAPRLLAPGSWVVTESHVRGTPAKLKQKFAVVAQSDGAERALEESRWSGDGFELAGPARPFGAADGRAFDEIAPAPQGVQPDRVVIVGPKRFVCAVATYEFRDPAGLHKTTLTLSRDKAGGTQLPPRTIIIAGREIPLPPDALQAEVTADGPDVGTRTVRHVVSLASPLRVNGQTLSCVVETTEARGTQGGKAIALASQEWYSHELPGQRLRALTCGTVGGDEVQSESCVVDFHVARPSSESPSPAHPSPAPAGGKPTILPDAE